MIRWPLTEIYKILNHKSILNDIVQIKYSHKMKTLWSTENIQHKVARYESLDSPYSLLFHSCDLVGPLQNRLYGCHLPLTDITLIGCTPSPTTRWRGSTNRFPKTPVESEMIVMGSRSSIGRIKRRRASFVGSWVVARAESAREWKWLGRSGSFVGPHGPTSSKPTNCKQE